MKTIQTINPATEEKIASYERTSLEMATEKITDAHETYLDWKNTTFEERSQLMHKLADIFDDKKEEYAQLATKEMGKIIKQSRSEIEKCAKICRYYADNIQDLLAEETIKTEAKKSYVTFQPLGVTLAVMPWNFPFYQVIRFA
ncbi:aldehyde dehydrogenase family protein, partial [Polaribacter sp.]|uniref:aldehyde dehydrogenase family protein n=1 Tax=Polaribacter sp. TaxID=1920175 RepID=UPI003F6ACC25